MGGFKRQATTAEAGRRLLEDAAALEQAGAFALVLECIPAELAHQASLQLRIPVIGIGSGPDCDGQVLVSYDLLGLTSDTPPFAKRKADLDRIVVEAARRFGEEVKAGGPA